MADLEIAWSGLDNALNDIEMKLATALRAVTDDLRVFGEGAKNEMVQTHTFQNRTYRLEGSIDFSMEDALTVTVFALTSYASDVEFGVPGRSRPYPYFWPVWYKWLALLEEKLKDDWPRSFGGN